MPKVNIQSADIREGLVKRVVDHYLKSPDFNGCSWPHLHNQPETSPELLRSFLRPLIAAGRLSVRYSEHGNPFVKTLPDPTVEVELEWLEKSDLSLVVLYPTKQELKGRVRANRHPGKPYTLELARGGAQLEPRFFDIAVLEQYRNDPRYSFRVSDVNGTIYDGDAGHAREADQVFLQSFGFAYNTSHNRAVAVYLRYLHDLSPEHQQLWKARELDGEFSLHPHYHVSTIRGMPPGQVQVLDALLRELATINEMAILMGRPPIFRKEFKDGRPKGLMFLIRPTSREFDAFVHLLDKVLSENIDKAFFGSDITLTEDRILPDGRIQRTHKGALRLLEEWLRMHSTPEHENQIIKIMVLRGF